MDLKTADVLALQSKFMRNDVTVQGFSAALTEQVRKLATETGKVAVYAGIDQVPEEVLDILAWQFDVLWYDPDAAIEVKREAIKNAIEIHKIKGTPAAIQRVIEIYFGDGEVEEWFQYGGDPGHFKVSTANPSANSEKAALLTKAVNAVKRLSSVFDGVTVHVTAEHDLYFGAAPQIAGQITLEQVM